jgi:hypothetical protein
MSKSLKEFLADHAELTKPYSILPEMVGAGSLVKIRGRLLSAANDLLYVIVGERTLIVSSDNVTKVDELQEGEVVLHILSDSKIGEVNLRSAADFQHSATPIVLGIPSHPVVRAIEPYALGPDSTVHDPYGTPRNTPASTGTGIERSDTQTDNITDNITDWHQD